MKDKVFYQYDINETVIHIRSNRKVMVDHFEVQKFNGFLYVIYCCNDEYGFQVKGHAIDFKKEN